MWPGERGKISSENSYLIKRGVLMTGSSCATLGTAGADRNKPETWVRVTRVRLSGQYPFAPRCGNRRFIVMEEMVGLVSSTEGPGASGFRLETTVDRLTRPFGRISPHNPASRAPWGI